MRSTRLAPTGAAIRHRALLEVLDPAQNGTFRDHYLELDLDLSDVVFVATANVLDTVPAPLLDRMEVIELDGYTTDEKVAIARDHLVDRQLEENGLDATGARNQRRRPTFGDRGLHEGARSPRAGAQARRDHAQDSGPVATGDAAAWRHRTRRRTRRPTAATRTRGLSRSTSEGSRAAGPAEAPHRRGPTQGCPRSRHRSGGHECRRRRPAGRSRQGGCCWDRRCPEARIPRSRRAVLSS